jgi:bifunctional UDP-N-acetylglucosamine pyrophosphorylase/glucosamine-1-phosphate N-acetyltransferase
MGDATIGEKTNVGGGTIFANWDGANRHKSQVGANVSLGAGTVLVGPCTVGDDAKTGAGAVLVAGTSVGKGDTWLGVPARRKGSGA